jgi:hypothetical protein
MAGDPHPRPGGLGRLRLDDPRDIDLETLKALESSFSPGATLQASREWVALTRRTA